MTEVKETGAAPVSKYAAKKAKLANAETVETTNTTVNRKPFAKKEDLRGKKLPNGMPASAGDFPEHIVQVALIIKNNAEIRRFTALGILNYLLQKGEISGEHRYVSFKWNKFVVEAGGLKREYFYTEPFFLNALVAAFSSFSDSAQRTINNFVYKEMSIGIDKAVDKSEVENIVAMNSNKDSDTADVAETAE